MPWRAWPGRPKTPENLSPPPPPFFHHTLPTVREWPAGFGVLLTFREPQAGALCLMRYHSATPSYELCERIRINQSVLIVPGVHLGLAGLIRLWLGGNPEFLS